MLNRKAIYHLFNCVKQLYNLNLYNHYNCMTKKIKYCVILIFLTCNYTNAFSQFSYDKDKIIQSLQGNIYNQYVSEELAKKMCDSLSEYNKKGKYTNIVSIDDFMYELTKDLRRISNDKHILIASNKKNDADKKTTQKRTLNFSKRKSSYKSFIKNYQTLLNKSLEDDFDYGDIKILPNNVGYLEIKEFNSILEDNSKNKKRIEIKNVMDFLKNTKSIIVDLRYNCGGDVNLAAKFCSYFTDKQSRYFTTLETNGRYDSSGVIIKKSFKNECKTFPTINNEITRRKKIIILVSNFTFSAGELTTYSIKKFNPETIVIGKKTAGAANAHTGFSDYYNYIAIIPSSRIYDVENKNHNLEGVGVIPDIDVNVDSAVLRAIKILDNGDTSNLAVTFYKKEIEYEITPYLKKHASEYIGDYNKVQIKYEGEKLFMIYDVYNRQLLTQDEDYIFLSPGFKTISFIKNINNEIIKIKIEHLNAYYEEFSKR